MAFPPSFLDELRTRLPLSQVVARSVRLVRKGREHSGLCPFHNEKSPSFTVNDDKGFFHCFGCGAHGDVIGFVMRIQGLSFPEAVEQLASEAGLPLPVEAPQDRERAKRAASLHDAMEAACRFFEKNLKSAAGQNALRYLADRRGLDPETIARFRLGFALDSRSALKSALLGGGVNETLAIEAGLLIKPEQGGESYDRFRGRVMFPIADRQGRVIAFGGRIMGDGQPKYLNSPDTPLFHKGHVLYNLAEAKKAATKINQIIVSEGYMDVIALARAGFTHAVAPLGTALTEQQLMLLWNVAPEPIICLDGDAAGRRAALRAANRALPLLKPGKSLRFALLPPPEDPDSLIKQRGAKAMADILAQAKPLNALLWEETLAQGPIDTPERRAGLEASAMALAESIADRTVRQHYERFFKDRMWDLGRQARQPRFSPKNPQRFSAAGKFASNRRRPTDPGPDGRYPGAGLPPRPRSPDYVRESQMLLLLINHPQLLEEASEQIGSVSFTDMALDKLRGEVLKQMDKWGSLDSEGTRRYLTEQGYSNELDALDHGGIHRFSDAIAPDSPIEAARELWAHVYRLYGEKELSVELNFAEQRLGSDMSEETLAYFSALQKSKNQEPEE